MKIYLFIKNQVGSIDEADDSEDAEYILQKKPAKTTVI